MIKQHTKYSFLGKTKQQWLITKPPFPYGWKRGKILKSESYPMSWKKYDNDKQAKKIAILSTSNSLKAPNFMPNFDLG